MMARAKMIPSNPSWSDGVNVPQPGPREGGKKYYFYVDNYDNYYTLAYRYNGRTYKLSPGAKRKHYSPDKYVTVTFDDRADRSGFQPWSKRFNAYQYDIGVRYDSSDILRYKLRD